ncbi:MAG: polysaccharide biosynthesis/export family protein [Gemmatimonadales bacterium]
MISRALLALAMAALLPAVGLCAQGTDGATSGFQPGDRVLLAVEGEQKLTDTFTVVTGPLVELPGIGPLSLAGVRRGDVEAYLTDQLGRYLKHPVVHARVLLRVEVVGEVVRPGFYAVPADALLSDAMMAAGGLTQNAKFASLSVVRHGSPVWEGAPLQTAIADGRTLDDLRLQSGDALVIPRRHDPESTMRIVAIVVTIPAAIFGITTLF